MGYIKSYQKNENYPQKGHGYGHVTYLNSSSPCNISWMAKDRDFKFCTLVRQVTVYHWDYKLSLEWAWSQLWRL